MDSIAALLEKLGLSQPGGLAKSAGISDIGQNQYVPPPQADINGPIDPAAVAAYLARTGQQFPPLFQVNQPAWEAAVERMPASRNIEDRRGEIAFR